MGNNKKILSDLDYEESNPFKVIYQAGVHRKKSDNNYIIHSDNDKRRIDYFENILINCLEEKLNEKVVLAMAKEGILKEKIYWITGQFNLFIRISLKDIFPKTNYKIIKKLFNYFLNRALELIFVNASIKSLNEDQVMDYFRLDTTLIDEINILLWEYTMFLSLFNEEASVIQKMEENDKKALSSFEEIFKKDANSELDSIDNLKIKLNKINETEKGPFPKSVKVDIPPYEPPAKKYSNDMFKEMKELLDIGINQNLAAEKVLKKYAEEISGISSIYAESFIKQFRKSKYYERKKNNKIPKKGN